jgi:hypothetical protein
VPPHSGAPMRVCNARTYPIYPATSVGSSLHGVSEGQYLSKTALLLCHQAYSASIAEGERVVPVKTSSHKHCGTPARPSRSTAIILLRTLKMKIGWSRSANAWIVLTKDHRIRYRSTERTALASASVRAFVLASSQLQGAEMATAFVKALPKGRFPST